MMATMIKGGGSDGAVRRCDGTCHNARQGSPCRCICGGMNHGAGAAQAARNTEEYVERIIAEHGPVTIFPRGYQAEAPI